MGSPGVQPSSKPSKLEPVPPAQHKTSDAVGTDEGAGGEGEVMERARISGRRSALSPRCEPQTERRDHGKAATRSATAMAVVLAAGSSLAMRAALTKASQDIL